MTNAFTTTAPKTPKSKKAAPPPAPRRQLVVDLSQTLYASLRMRAARETATSGRFVSMSSIVAAALKAWMLSGARDAGEGNAS